MLRSSLGALLLLSLSTGCGLVTRPLDVYYRAGWMIAHHDDQRAFPPKSNLCMETFCTRTDTTKKFAGGHKGYTSQAYYYYCPIHQPSFVNTGSRFDGFLRFVYWGTVFLISHLLAFGFFSLPALGLQRLFAKRTDFVELVMPVTYLAFGISAAAWLMFAIW